MAYPIKIEGVLFWGKKSGMLRMEELEQTLTPLDSILHLLRHFQQVPTAWKKRMIEDEGIAEEVIKKELSEPGSKWNTKLEPLETPEKVTQFCLMILRWALRKNQALRWINRRKLDLCYSSHLITPDLKREVFGHDSEPIGTQGLVRLEELPKGVVAEKGLRKISTQEQPVVVNVVAINPLPTDRVVIALARKPDRQIRIWTAYPGIITPHFPRPNQFPEEQEYNEAFWEEYALTSQ